MIHTEIFSYTPNDQQEVENLFCDAWGDSQFPPDFNGRHSDLRNIMNVYQINGGGFWLMRHSQKIIGTVAIKCLQEKVSEIKRLNVMQQYRGHGYGDKLFKHAVNHAIKNGFDLIWLDSVRTFGPALHLYEKYGFTEIPRYNDNPKADIFMELNLQKIDKDRFIINN